MGPIKGKKTKTGADMYEGLSDAHMSFAGIRVFEAAGGDIILRGRNGQRDVLFPLEKAVQKYTEWTDLTYTYARQGIHGWDEMMDIGKEFRARIDEACDQRKKLNRPIPDSVKILLGMPTATAPEH